jgi:hypothetical protein
VAQVYEPRRQRTVDLVQGALATLVARQARISLATLAAATKAIDPEGQGVSESGILTNQEAYQAYVAQRTWQRAPQRRPPPALERLPRTRHPVKAQRNLARAQQRYLQLSKATLVARLLATEQAYAEVHARWLGQADALLEWQLRAREAERRLAAQAEPHARREDQDAKT